jgi:dimeric dUTPase (all-alpha-NTP-PPase superfamily)
MMKTEEERQEQLLELLVSVGELLDAARCFTHNTVATYLRLKNVPEWIAFQETFHKAETCFIRYSFKGSLRGSGTNENKR